MFDTEGMCVCVKKSLSTPAYERASVHGLHMENAADEPFNDASLKKTQRKIVSFKNLFAFQKVNCKAFDSLSRTKTCKIVTENCATEEIKVEFHNCLVHDQFIAKPKTPPHLQEYLLRGGNKPSSN